MTWFVKFARYNEIFASTMGILLNLLLAYLVCTVKSKIGNISRILLQNCVLDMCLSTVTFVAGLHPFIVNRMYYIIIGSWLHIHGVELASYLVAFYAAFVMLSIQALPIPFYVRYQMLCNNKVVTVKHFLVLYGIIAVAFIIQFSTSIICYPPIFAIYEPFKAATMTEFWLNEFPNGPVFVVRKIEDIQLIAFVGFAFLTSAVSYCLVLFYSIKITQYLRVHADTVKQTKIDNKQLHRTLIAQAFGPIISGNCPIFLLIVMIFLGYENNYVTVGLSSMVGYIGFVNPLAALIIIAPYRRKVAEILKFHRPATHSRQISVAPMTNPLPLFG